MDEPRVRMYSCKMDPKVTSHLGLIVTALGGLWGVMKLLIGSYVKAQKKVLQIERESVQQAIKQLKEVTRENTQDLKATSFKLHELDKKIDLFAQRLTQFEASTKDLGEHQESLGQIIKKVLLFIGGKGEQSEVIQLGSAYLVRKKKE